jgi:hypothetical protein
MELTLIIAGMVALGVSTAAITIILARDGRRRKSPRSGAPGESGGFWGWFDANTGNSDSPSHHSSHHSTHHHSAHHGTSDAGASHHGGFDGGGHGGHGGGFDGGFGGGHH